MDKRPLHDSLLRKDNDRNSELKYLLDRFPQAEFSFGRDYSTFNYRPYRLIGLILYLAGAKEINFGVSFLSGRKDIYNINIHSNSFIVEPYLKSPTNGVNLLWWLLKKLKTPYSGGAGEDKGGYMQASWHKSENDINDIINTFNTLKKLNF